MAPSLALAVWVVALAPTDASTVQCNNFESSKLGPWSGKQWKLGGASPDASLVDFWIYQVPLPSSSGNRATIMAHCVDPPTIGGQPAPWQIWKAEYIASTSSIIFPAKMCEATDDTTQHFWAYTCSESATSSKLCYQSVSGDWTSWKYWKNRASGGGGDWYVTTPTFTCQDPTSKCSDCLRDEIKKKLEEDLSCNGFELFASKGGTEAAMVMVQRALQTGMSSYLDTASIQGAVDFKPKYSVSGSSDKTEVGKKCKKCFDAVVSELKDTACTQCKGGSWGVWSAASVMDSNVQSRCDSMVDELLANITTTTTTTTSVSRASGGGSTGGSSSSDGDDSSSDEDSSSGDEGRQSVGQTSFAFAAAPAGVVLFLWRLF